MERFIDFSDGKALMVNNGDWLLGLNYVDFLREIGPHFSVNRMLTAECYKQRMEKGLSFLEFNYMLMQSYDFYMLKHSPVRYGWIQTKLLRLIFISTGEMWQMPMSSNVSVCSLSCR